MQEIQITLNIPEVNRILDALGNQPYSEVYELIARIQAQAETQLQNQTPTPDSGEPL